MLPRREILRSKSMLAKIQPKYVDCLQIHDLLGFRSKADDYVHENYYVNLPCTPFVN